MYHLEFQKDDEPWLTIASGQDVMDLLRRRETFIAHCGGLEDGERMRIVAIEPPAEVVPLAERDASALLTVITLGLVVGLIALIGLIIH